MVVHEWRNATFLIFYIKIFNNIVTKTLTPSLPCYLWTTPMLSLSKSVKQTVVCSWCLDVYNLRINGNVFLFTEFSNLLDTLLVSKVWASLWRTVTRSWASSCFSWQWVSSSSPRWPTSSRTTTPAPPSPTCWMRTGGHSSPWRP